MLFNSLEFLFFFGAVAGLYFCTPHRFRWMLLLAASYYFYACWKLEYLVLIAVSTLIDYGAAFGIAGAVSKAGRRLWLSLSLGTNLGILFAFKYLDFFGENLRAIFRVFDVAYHVPSFELLLPVGISFYTFQTLSYTIDVYRGKREPERHLGRFALYVSFFPQLVAGPIERSTRLLPQFYRRHAFDWERVKGGLLLMLWGFFKKLVIADRVAAVVNQVHANPGAHESVYLLLASYLFVYQLYCDFSGYTDVALGAAQVLGFELTQNFRRPFAATSPRDFWARWHISLMRWIRDYVYVPLARCTTAKGQRLGVVLFVFLLFGLWHGADWTFVVFGLLAGLVTVAEPLLRWGRRHLRALWPSKERLVLRTGGISLPAAPRLRRGLSVFLSFNLIALVCLPFRAQSVQDLLVYVEGLLTPVFSQEVLATLLTAPPVFSRYEMGIAVAAITVMELVQWIDARTPVWQGLLRQPVWVRWPVYYALVFSILMFGAFEVRPFIYFQF